MNKNEIVKLRVMQVDERDVPAKYIEAFNSYLDKVVIPYFEKQLAEKDKELRHQICEKISKGIYDDLVYDPYDFDWDGFDELVDKIEKGDEE